MNASKSIQNGRTLVLYFFYKSELLLLDLEFGIIKEKMKHIISTPFYMECEHLQERRVIYVLSREDNRSLIKKTC